MQQGGKRILEGPSGVKYIINRFNDESQDTQQQLTRSRPQSLPVLPSSSGISLLRAKPPTSPLIPDRYRHTDATPKASTTSIATSFPCNSAADSQDQSSFSAPLLPPPAAGPLPIVPNEPELTQKEKAPSAKPKPPVPPRRANHTASAAADSQELSFPVATPSLPLSTTGPSHVIPNEPELTQNEKAPSAKPKPPVPPRNRGSYIAIAESTTSNFSPSHFSPSLCGSSEAILTQELSISVATTALPIHATGPGSIIAGEPEPFGKEKAPSAKPKPPVPPRRDRGQLNSSTSSLSSSYEGTFLSLQPFAL